MCVAPRVRSRPQRTCPSVWLIARGSCLCLTPVAMLSALFLINQKGEIVIHRFYRDDISLTAAHAFRMQVRDCLQLWRGRCNVTSTLTTHVCIPASLSHSCERARFYPHGGAVLYPRAHTLALCVTALPVRSHAHTPLCVRGALRRAQYVQVIAAKEAGSAAPVRNIEGNTFLYIRHKDMFFVAVTRTNANAGTCRLHTRRTCVSAQADRACACAFSMHCMRASLCVDGRVQRSCSPSCTPWWTSSRATSRKTLMRTASVTTSRSYTSCWMVRAACVRVLARLAHLLGRRIAAALHVITPCTTAPLSCADAEILDYGYPQNSSLDVLKMYINLGSLKAPMASGTCLRAGCTLVRKCSRMQARTLAPHPVLLQLRKRR